MMLQKKINAVLYRLILAPYYKFSLAQFGNNSKIIKPTAIDGPKRIFIGDQVLICHYGWLAADPITGNKDCKLIIGDGTYIGRFSHIYATSKIEIGKKVLIADKVYISDNLHGHKNIHIPVIDQPVVQANEVMIGDGAWLGENVCVVGASVGKNCVIGANAVVTKNIPDYCIAVGIPAKVIKRYNFEINDWQSTDESGEFI
jgi:acetyltransferase-like isoleucine patch superfamily enzyme